MMLKLRPNKLTLLLSIIAMGLFAMNCVVLLAKAAGYDLGGLVPLFDMDQEQNLPTFFSTFLAVIASSLLLMIGLVRKQMQRRWGLWIGLSAVFLFVGIDDFVGIHEQLSRPIRSYMPTNDLLYFAWIIPYCLLVMLLAGIYGRFVFEMPVGIRNGLLLAATLFLAGSLGFEVLEDQLLAAGFFSKSAFYGVLTTVEESLELAGLIVFIHTLMNYIESIQKNILLLVGGHDPLANIAGIAGEFNSTRQHGFKAKNSSWPLRR